MPQVVRARFVTCAMVIPALVCTSMAGRVAADATPTPADSEAVKVDAARHHPVAQPEPRPLYPSEQPPPRELREPPDEAPAPQAPRAATPPLAPRSVEAPVYPGETYPAQIAAQDALEGNDGAEGAVVAPQPPPPPREETVLVAPEPGYVWAPGYWYWYGGSYVWIGGSWLPPRPGYVYVGARWIHGYNGWAFAAGGWSVGGGVVVYPIYRHSYLWAHPYAGHHYGHHHSGHHGHPHQSYYGHPGHHYGPSYRYSSNYRRNAPPAYVSQPRPVHHGTHRHNAPSAYSPRGSRSVHAHPRR